MLTIQVGFNKDNIQKGRLGLSTLFNGEINMHETNKYETNKWLNHPVVNKSVCVIDCKHVTFDCDFLLAFLVESCFRLIQYIAIICWAYIKK